MTTGAAAFRPFGVTSLIFELRAIAMRRVVAWALLLLVLGLAGVGVFYLTEGAQADRAEAAATSAGRSTASAPVVSAGDGSPGDESGGALHTVVERAAPTLETPAPAPASASRASLPALGLPLHETAAALLAAHRGGDGKATRRLMDELTECMGYRRSSLNMDMAIAFQDGGGREGRRGRGSGGDERMQRWLSNAAESVAKLRENCESLPDDYDQELLFELQRRAAEGGELAGQLAFALVPALSLNQSLLQLDRLQIYRELAPQMLQRALEQGSAQAVAGFMQGYEFYFEGWRGRHQESTAMQTQALQRMIRSVRPLTPIQQVLGEDLAQAYGYALLCKRVCNAQDRGLADAALLRLGSALDVGEIDAAQEQANTLYDRHFATRPRPEDIDIEALRQAIVGFGRMGGGG